MITAAVSPAGSWAGASPAAPSVALTIKARTVVSATAWASQFDCELGGFVGPAQVTVKPMARVTGTGLIKIDAGSKSRRLKASLRFRKGRIRGRIKIVGNVGGPCTSPTIPVTLIRR